MAHIKLAFDQVIQGDNLTRVNAFGTLLLWFLVGGAAFSAALHYTPFDSSLLSVLIGGLGGLGIAALIKSL